MKGTISERNQLSMALRSRISEVTVQLSLVDARIQKCVDACNRNSLFSPSNQIILFSATPGRQTFEE